MVAKKNRLKKEEDILLVLKKGVQVKDPYYRLYILEGRNSKVYGRIGVVLKNKDFKRSTQRNQCRRRIYAAFGKMLTEWRGYDVVVMPFFNFMEIPFQVLVSDLKKHNHAFKNRLKTH